jgi:hypothetical protein
MVEAALALQPSKREDIRLPLEFEQDYLDKNDAKQRTGQGTYPGDTI